MFIAFSKAHHPSYQQVNFYNMAKNAFRAYHLPNKAHPFLVKEPSSYGTSDPAAT